MSGSLRRLPNPVLFVCDLQEKFKNPIFEFPKIVATTQKMLKASQILKFPVFATTQNRARLGDLVEELRLDVPGGIKTHFNADKTLFSMCTPALRESLAKLSEQSSADVTQSHGVVVVGIESHICVTQTTLDLLRDGYKVYVLADGVSSCNKEEIPIALARLRQEGAVVTTSECWLYETVRDAGLPEFKEIIKLVKETSSATRDVLQTLCKI